MTREEAIDIIKCLAWHTRPNEEDIELAIKTLSAEPCEDCISRQAVLDKAVYTETEEGWSGRTVDVKDIEVLPPVTPKQKMGHWIHFAWSDDCSECGWSTGKYESPTKFCPNCGAKMEVEENG